MKNAGFRSLLLSMRASLCVPTEMTGSSWVYRAMAKARSSRIGRTGVCPVREFAGI